MHNAYEVAKFICHNEGIVEAGGGQMRGNPDGMRKLKIPASNPRVRESLSTDYMHGNFDDK